MGAYNAYVSLLNYRIKTLSKMVEMSKNWRSWAQNQNKTVNVKTAKPYFTAWKRYLADLKKNKREKEAARKRYNRSSEKSKKRTKHIKQLKINGKWWMSESNQRFRSFLIIYNNRKIQNKAQKQRNDNAKKAEKDRARIVKLQEKQRITLAKEAEKNRVEIARLHRLQIQQVQEGVDSIRNPSVDEEPDNEDSDESDVTEYDETDTESEEE